MNIAERLAAYTASFRYRDLDNKVIVECKNRLLDSLGCGIGALDEKPVKTVRNLVLRNYPGNAATILGTRRKTTPDLATFANGLAVRYFYFNDHYRTKEGSHPSDNIAACLAVAEMRRKSGKDLLAAIVLADKSRGFVSNQKRAVAFVARNLVVAVPVKSPVARVLEIIYRAVVRPVLMLEPAARRQILRLEVAEVPLAEDRRGVSHLTQCLRQRAFLQRQTILCPRPHHAHLQAVPHRITSREQRRARW